MGATDAPTLVGIELEVLETGTYCCEDVIVIGTGWLIFCTLSKLIFLTSSYCLSWVTCLLGNYGTFTKVWLFLFSTEFTTSRGGIIEFKFKYVRRVCTSPSKYVLIYYTNLEVACWKVIF